MTTVYSNNGESIQIDATSILKNHWLENPSFTYDKGFMLELGTGSNSAGTIEFESSNSGGSVGDRPQLIVDYKSPIFGAHVGSGFDYPSKTSYADGTLDFRMRNQKNDNLTMTRLFTDAWAAHYNLGKTVAKARELSCKIIYSYGFLFDDFYNVTRDSDGFFTNISPRTYSDAADRVYNYFTTQGTFSFGSDSVYLDLPKAIEDGIVEAIEFVNEDDASVGYIRNTYGTFTSPLWYIPSLGVPLSNVNFNATSYSTSLTWYEGGKNMGKYMAAAISRLRTRYPNLLIMAPGISHHHSMAFSDDSNYPGRGKEAKSFLRGLINGALTNPTYGHVRNLPDIISIHGYAPAMPEGNISTDSNWGMRPWFERLNQLRQICSLDNYYPEFAVSEYGFGSRNYAVGGAPAEGFTCANANEKTQAAFYMRRALIDASFRTDYLNGNGYPFTHSTWYSHSYDGANSTPWIGSASDTTWIQYTQWDKAVRTVGRTMHNLSVVVNGQTMDAPGLNQNYKPWLPGKSIEVDAYNKVYKITCGWVNQDNKKWGAIWKYKNGFEDDGWKNISDSTEFIEVNESNPPLYAKAYKFSFTFTDYPYLQNPNRATATWTYQGTYNRQFENGVYRYYIPNINENPTFIHFTNN